jgi:hypothetical protein
MKVPLQGLKKLVKRGGNPDHAEHEAILLEPMVNGRLHTLPSHWPRMASPAAAVKTFPLLSPEKVSQDEKLSHYLPAYVLDRWAQLWYDFCIFGI